LLVIALLLADSLRLRYHYSEKLMVVGIASVA
jgi:hypothetical protein